MGHHGAVLRVPDVQAFHSEDRQQPIDLHHDDAKGHRWVNASVGFDFKIEYLKGTNNKVADIFSHVEARLDDATSKELLADCPNTVLKGAGYASMNEDPEAWTKVQKQAVNEVIERAKFQHILHAEADNPMLIAMHEEVEKENTAFVT